MRRISNVFGTTLLVKVFPIVFVGASILFVAVAIKNRHGVAVLFFFIPLLIFVFSNPSRYLNLKEVFLDYESGKIAVSMGNMKWKEYVFDELIDVTSGSFDGILKLHFKNGDIISFLATSLWGKEKELQNVKKELTQILDKNL
ncbi:MAG TPA: hypothetical protein VFN30_14070 [Chitinophagaceae bacterium]|nr:hypothetical protein [Chitinophagaceae bacterium]